MCHAGHRPGRKTLSILAVAEEHVRRAILLNYYLGCRAGPVETFSLRWTAVRWESETILVISANKAGSNPGRLRSIQSCCRLLKAWWKADARATGISSTGALNA